ncbi:hypothetical protein K439DRAFT_1649197 [Ramaria rubella]|nr:hypothetical protein K439DRAFT_1649197 [Ramaria rubella]
MSVVPKLMPFTYQMYCLHHLEGNTLHAHQPILRDSWNQFKQDFWTFYHSVSPEIFDTRWKVLESTYPAAKTDLTELFTSHEHWAHPWTSQHFTAGIRTNSWVESENHVNKALGGPKQMAYELFNLLNQRTQTQTDKEMTQVHEATQRHHDDNLEVLFTKPLALLCEYLSIYYHAEVLQLPDGHRAWHMHNAFSNDNSLISTTFLLHLITGQGFRIQHLLRIIHLGTSTAHMLAILESGSYVCDSTMGTNLGINC